MSQVTLTIKPEDTNYDPETRVFDSRPSAQAKVNELYGNGYIDRKEWSRLTDSLSPEFQEPVKAK